GSIVPSRKGTAIGQYFQRLAENIDGRQIHGYTIIAIAAVHFAVRQYTQHVHVIFAFPAPEHRISTEANKQATLIIYTHIMHIGTIPYNTITHNRYPSAI